MRRATLAHQLETLSSVPDAKDLSTLINAFAGIGKELARLIGDRACGAPVWDRADGARPLPGDEEDRIELPHGHAEQRAQLASRAHEIVRRHLGATGCVAKLVSALRIDAEEICVGEHARFVVYADPLDGLGDGRTERETGELGSIFGVYERHGGTASVGTMLRGGAEQVAAAYLLYGADTVFVYTTGAGVEGHTLDRARDAFVLTHERIRCPDRGGLLGANLHRARDWPCEIREFIEHLTERGPQRHRYSLRHCGTVVADLHRSLLHGGVTLFPPDREHENGALQLLNDCAPLAMIAEQAGGKASTGHDRILDLRAYSLHEHSPLVIGSARDVELCEQFMCGRAPAAIAVTKT